MQNVAPAAVDDLGLAVCGGCGREFAVGPVTLAVLDARADCALTCRQCSGGGGVIEQAPADTPVDLASALAPDEGERAWLALAALAVKTCVKTCVKCHSELPAELAYSAWCDRCYAEWSLLPLPDWAQSPVQPAGDGQ